MNAWQLPFEIKIRKSQSLYHFSSYAEKGVLEMSPKSSRVLAALSIGFLFASTVFAAGDAKKGAKVFKKVGCATCHNADAMGKAKPDALDKQKGPQIAGLDEAYAVAQITAIAKKERVTETTVDMQRKVATMTPDQILDVAAYVNTLAPKHKGMKE
jgi:cytochrome c553